MNLKAFMKSELKNRGTMEFPGIKRFCNKDGKPIPFIIKCLSQAELKEIRNLYRTTKVYKDKNGRPVVQNGQVAVVKEYDAEKAGLHMMVDAFVQPKLDDPELMDYYGVLDRLDMPQTIFSESSEFRYANECLLEALGMKDDENEEETVETIKN